MARSDANLLVRQPRSGMIGTENSGANAELADTCANLPNAKRITHDIERELNLVGPPESSDSNRWVDFSNHS